MKFPTVEWFQALREQARQRAETFRRLGFCDAAVGIRVLAEGGPGEGRAYLLRFDGYRCKAVEATAAPEKIADFVLEGKYSAWKEMIENIKANGGPDLKHSLNYLTLPGDPIRVVAKDQLKQDLFFRYNGTLQEFFNGAQHLETEFAA
ncbi:MAG: hypothetical protein HYS09_00020 [Chloroflexi bacterium]|nr:hypothetical protein [Chloroflexota bacterium]